jgi:hypothetical protein
MTRFTTNRRPGSLYELQFGLIRHHRENGTMSDHSKVSYITFVVTSDKRLSDDGEIHQRELAGAEALRPLSGPDLVNVLFQTHCAFALVMAG